MRIKAYGSYDLMMSELLREKVDVAIFPVEKAVYVNWVDQDYDLFIREAFPFHRVYDHGDYQSIVTFDLTTAQVSRKLIQSIEEF